MDDAKDAADVAAQMLVDAINREAQSAAASNCQCCCGETVEGSHFLPGHDQRLRVALEARVGGLLALRELVAVIESYASGGSNLEELGKSVRRAFWKNQRGPSSNR